MGAAPGKNWSPLSGRSNPGFSAVGSGVENAFATHTPERGRALEPVTARLLLASKDRGQGPPPPSAENPHLSCPDRQPCHPVLLDGTHGPASVSAQDEIGLSAVWPRIGDPAPTRVVLKEIRIVLDLRSNRGAFRGSRNSDIILRKRNVDINTNRSRICYLRLK